VRVTWGLSEIRSKRLRRSGLFLRRLSSPWNPVRKPDPWPRPRRGRRRWDTGSLTAIPRITEGATQKYSVEKVLLFWREVQHVGARTIGNALSCQPETRPFDNRRQGHSVMVGVVLHKGITTGGAVKLPLLRFSTPHQASLFSSASRCIRSRNRDDSPTNSGMWAQ
jgi:hypothetical protein